MPIDPIAAANTAVSVVDLGVGLISDIAKIIGDVRTKSISEEEGRKRLAAAADRLKAADRSLDAILADNDRFIDALPKLPEPTAPASPSPALVPVAPPPVGGPAAPPAAGTEPTGES